MLDQSAKQWVLGSAVGQLWVSGRDTLDLVKHALRTPESVGTVANDQCAMHLLVGLPAAGSVFLDVGRHNPSVLAGMVRRDASIRIVAVDANLGVDDLVAPEGIDMMNVDVEGGELSVLSVLQGCSKLVAASRPVIVFESEPADAAGLALAKPAIWRFFAEAGYTLHLPIRVAHNDDGLCLESFIDSHVYPRPTTHYVAIPHERRIEIRDRARALLGIVVA